MSHTSATSIEAERYPSDPVLGCLMALARRHRRLVTEDILAGGLTTGRDGRLDISAIPIAATRAGFAAEFFDGPFQDLTADQFPALLLLADDDACLLVGRRGDGTYEVQLPDSSTPAIIPAATLAARYSGRTVILRRREAATDDETTAAQGPRGDAWRLAMPFALASMPGDATALTVAAFLPHFSHHWGTAPRTVAIAAAMAVVIEGAFRLLHALLLARAGRPAGTALASRLFRQLLAQERSASPGAFAEALRAFEADRTALAGKAVASLTGLPFVMAILAAVAWLGGILVFLPLGCAVLAIVLGLALAPASERAAQRRVRDQAKRQGQLVETLAGADSLRALGAETRMTELWDGRSALSAASTQAARRLEIIATGVPALLQAGALVGVAAWGIALVADGTMTAAALAVCLLLTGRALSWASEAAPLLARPRSARSAILGLGDTSSMIEKTRAEPTLGRPELTELVLRDLTFRPSDGPPLFEKLSLDLAPGQHLALAGRPGSGKSTLLRLVLGIHRPSSGEIRINGLAPGAIPGLIGYSPQEPLLFAGSLRENLLLGRPGADEASLQRALRLAGIEDLAERVGMHGPVGERGSLLSFGERQGVGLARALLGDPPLLVLDDPCSSWDDAALAALAERLRPELAGRTLILASARLLLWGLAERKATLGDGRLVEEY